MFLNDVEHVKNYLNIWFAKQIWLLNILVRTFIGSLIKILCCQLVLKISWVNNLSHIQSMCILILLLFCLMISGRPSYLKSGVLFLLTVKHVQWSASTWNASFSVLTKTTLPIEPSICRQTPGWYPALIQHHMNSWVGCLNLNAFSYKIWGTAVHKLPIVILW